MQNVSQSILVHICCSVDSHHFLSELKKLYPTTKIIGYFYNPNIHPFEEYTLRLLDVERSCNLLDIELIDEEYDFNHWLVQTKGYEDAPEKGERCEICFSVRLHKTAKKAKQLNLKFISTTLLTSPMKPQEELFALGEKISTQYNLGFISLDTRSSGGTQRQQALAKEAKLYRQNYCGCLYALTKQRDKSSKQPTELFCPISQKHYAEFPIPLRLALYKKRMELEQKQIPYRLIKQRKMFYYPQFTILYDQFKNQLPCYVLTHSLFPYCGNLDKMRSQKVDMIKLKNGIFCSLNSEVYMLSLEFYNHFFKRKDSSITELLFSGTSTEEELECRNAIEGDRLGSSLILVVDSPQESRYSITHFAFFQEEILERIVTEE
ncbi:hypothetical protein CCZ01_02205 [Helicobacter monodelphidis]|uniref:epoxyqueuosine reductase QueH n=1 Tax=Helicobacter sp. 15-1451 TaxID=2004995 RepID=UPI000DCBC17F|nr:epoxyqueuosine reductase QueH [Helicobacter sp. 15-1451]RAX58620.1 hypothetical protein CCZ01_02205 [Helicobacter sp. 15-1451]